MLKFIHNLCFINLLNNEFLLIYIIYNIYFFCIIKKIIIFKNLVMQGSGRLRPAMVAAPKPVDLPSLRKQNKGLDPTISLVPSGSCWGKSKKDDSNPWNHSNSKFQSQDFPTAAEVLKEEVYFLFLFFIFL